MHTCKFDLCDRKHYGHGYCQMHYQHLKRYGRVGIINRYSKRNALIEGNIAKIPLGVNAKDGYAVVDRADAERVSLYKWHKTSHGYVAAYIHGHGIVYLHRFVTAAPNGLIVDHKHGDKLDNRRSQLQIATQVENMLNASRWSTNTSGHTGVIWNKSTSKWIARVKIRGRTYNLGSYKLFDDAVNARHRAEKDLARLLTLSDVDLATFARSLRPLQPHNSSGYVGVSWCKRERRWQAMIQVKGKRIGLGYYKEKAKAIEARERAALLL